MAEVVGIVFHVVMGGFDAVGAGFVQPVRGRKFYSKAGAFFGILL
jgi:hypothetical protein